MRHRAAYVLCAIGWVVCGLVPLLGGVTVSEEPLRDRKGRETGWRAIRLDSGVRLYELRTNGRELGLGPNSDNWYGNGFLRITCDEASTTETDGSVRVLERGPAVAVAEATWQTSVGPVCARFALHDGDDKLLLTVTLPQAKSRRVRLVCYPSSFAGGYHQGKDVRQRRSVTALRQVVLGEKHSDAIDLGQDEPWVLFMDDHFDVAHSRGSGPCAALYFPHESARVAAITGNYACYLDLWPLPTMEVLHIVLWDLSGMTNADGVKLMKSIELTPGNPGRTEGKIEP